MKKVIYLLIALFAMLGIANADATGLFVDISKYQPYPAEPGKYIDVWISVQNVGKDQIENVQLKILPHYPFSIDPDENVTKNLGTLIGGQTSVLKFRMRVDPNAVQGDNYFNIQYKYDGFDWVTKRLNIFVQTHDSILSVNKILTEPQTLTPGSTGKLIFEVQNLADSFLSNVKIKLNLSNENLPFVIINSSSEKWIYIIESGKSANISFDILAFPDAESKIYKIPFEISYYDSLGTKYTKQDTLGLIVGNTPSIDVLLEKTTIKQAGSTGTVVFELVNNGLTNVKFLTAEIEKTQDFELISPAKVYIGELQSDDTDSFEATIHVNPTTKSNIDLPIKLHYFDSNNNEYQVTKNVQLRLYSPSEISAYHLNGNNSLLFTIIALFAIGIAGWFIYTKFVKKKNDFWLF